MSRDLILVKSVTCNYQLENKSGSFAFFNPIMCKIHTEIMLTWFWFDAIHLGFGFTFRSSPQMLSIPITWLHSGNTYSSQSKSVPNWLNKVPPSIFSCWISLKSDYGKKISCKCHFTLSLVFGNQSNNESRKIIKYHLWFYLFSKLVHLEMDIWSSFTHSHVNPDLALFFMQNIEDMRFCLFVCF